MNDKQQRMYDWIVERIEFAMSMGDLTEQMAMDAVTEADKQLTAVKELRARS